MRPRPLPADVRTRDNPSLEGTSDSNSVPSSISALSTLPRLKRPNYLLYLHEALILRWENKFHEENLSLARDENTSKLRLWSNFYYEELSYVIGGCCGGRRFQWLKLSPTPNSEVKSEIISQEYDLSTASEVMLLLRRVVQIHRLLQVL
jgi:hypothetical protein